MIKLFQSSWMTALLGVALYLGITVALVRPAALHMLRQQALGAAKYKPQAFSLEGNSFELNQLMAELRKEKEDLTSRELQLNELAARLQTERQEINAATQAVALLQKEFDQSIVRVREEESANLKKMAKVYAAMTPEGAAAILKNMEDNEVVKYLVYMKDGDTAVILEALAKLTDTEPKRAAQISDKLRTATFRNTTGKSP